MSGKKAVSGLATGAATGAALGAGVGSIVPGIGTAIGGAVGAIGGGLVGLFAGSSAADDVDPEAQRAEIERQKAQAQKDAYSQFMLGEAARMGANPTLIAHAQYQNNLNHIDAGYLAREQDAQEYARQANAVNPQDLLTLARVGSGVGQKLYNTSNVQTPVDIGTSPEVNVAPDPENLQALRKGKLMGFGGQTY